MRVIPFIAAFALVGCATHKTRLIEAEWASMTRTTVPHSKDVVEVGHVEANYCFSSFKSGDVGLMDEALSAAQKQYSVDYVRNATFYYDRQNICVSVEGQGFRSKKL